MSPPSVAVKDPGPLEEGTLLVPESEKGVLGGESISPPWPSAGCGEKQSVQQSRHTEYQLEEERHSDMCR